MRTNPSHPPLSQAKASYQKLREQIRRLQECTALYKVDLDLFERNPEYYSPEKIGAIRGQYEAAAIELATVTEAERGLLADNPELVQYLERRDQGTIDETVMEGSTIALTRLSEVTSTPIQWLWQGRIPRGKLTVIDGDPGLGKSLFTLDIAARVTTAREMPDGSRGDLKEPAGVVLLTAEDDLADTIRPRLDAAGADCSRVVALSAVRNADGERLPTLVDLEALREAITSTNAKLVIVDPLMAFLPGSVNSYRDQDVRRVLAPLAALAMDTGAAVVIVRHLTKASGGEALYRGGGEHRDHWCCTKWIAHREGS